MPEQKQIKCLDCKLLATNIIKEFGVGVCKKCGEKLLVAAILLRITSKV